MVWIKIEDELPIQKFIVDVRNGTRIYQAYYYRKKWYSYRHMLHKVKEWRKCPVGYPKIPKKDLEKYLARAKELRNQIKSRKFNF